ncbi:hypothetical protein GCM10010464_64510 [Pseudonocardia yunnanensis]|uniref:Uncharacterized protein n=1 Tax=Pseudonocardia yunnanensis TaxID=58107 RepID=A0ABW4ETW6_9PSEU
MSGCGGSGAASSFGSAGVTARITTVRTLDVRFPAPGADMKPRTLDEHRFPGGAVRADETKRSTS